MSGISFKPVWPSDTLLLYIFEAEPGAAFPHGLPILLPTVDRVRGLKNYHASGNHPIHRTISVEFFNCVE